MNVAMRSSPSASAGASPLAVVALAAAVALGLPACAQAPSEPCPTDDALIELFHAHGLELAQLVANPGNEDLRATLKVVRVVRDPDGRTWLWMWHKDFPGPGGVMKGYLFGKPAPLPSSLVPSIDAVTDPGGPEDKELYRHLEGDWYLFYRSSN